MKKKYASLLMAFAVSASVASSWPGHHVEGQPPHHHPDEQPLEHTLLVRDPRPRPPAAPAANGRTTPLPKIPEFNALSLG